MMKKVILSLLLGLSFLAISTLPAYASPFSDNFNDGNTNGWWLIDGNWRVENRMLVQDGAGDHHKALVKNNQISSQAIRTKLKIGDPSGYGGIIVWYKDSGNWVNIFVYPAGEGVFITEKKDGVDTPFKHPIFTSNLVWYNLKIEADSSSGNLKVYLDNTYLFTYSVTTLNRTGLSGLFSGNAGGYFDNFSIKPLTKKR